MKKLSDKKLKKVNGGSTVITAAAQTFRNQGKGSHSVGNTRRPYSVKIR